jgi:hypothetical protein
METTNKALLENLDSIKEEHFTIVKKMNGKSTAKYRSI